MPVIRRRDDHSIDILVEDFTVVEVRSGLPIRSLLDRLAVRAIDVANSDDLVRACLRRVNAKEMRISLLRCLDAVGFDGY